MSQLSVTITLQLVVEHVHLLLQKHFCLARLVIQKLVNVLVRMTSVEKIKQITTGLFTGMIYDRA